MSAEYLQLMLWGYLLSVAIETPLLFVGLSRRHGWRTRLFAGVWLTMCTYPVVWLVLPAWIDLSEQRVLYLAAAETFAPAAECLLFWLAFGQEPPRTRPALIRDMAAIVAANLASFATGMLVLE